MKNKINMWTLSSITSYITVFAMLDIIITVADLTNSIVLGNSAVFVLKTISFQ